MVREVPVWAVRALRRRVARAIRYVRRYMRPGGSVPPGDVTASGLPAAVPDAWRDPKIFRAPGALALAPRARLTAVSSGAETFLLPADGDFDVLQGGCTDGVYAYLVLEDQRPAGDGQGGHRGCVIVKVDMDTWQVTAKSARLPLHHGNDLTYNPRTGQLLAVHCYGRPNDISFIDPQTLAITETREYFHSVYGIAYNAKRDQYVMAIRGGYDFAVFDSRFELVSYVKGVDTRFVKQGIDCDDDYIYFATSEKNAIVCYDWSGRYRGVYAVKGCDREAENIFHRGDEWYMACYLGGHQGGCVYRVQFDRGVLAG